MRSTAIYGCLPVLIAFVAGCGDDSPGGGNTDPVCTANSTQVCACPSDPSGTTSGTATCAGDGSAWGSCVCPTCDTQDYTACDTDGNVYFYDSCDVKGELSVTCPTNSTCVETGATAGCECTNGWTGVGCDVCPANFTGASCDTCANEWTGTGCDSCPVNFNAGANCSGCANQWTGAACDVCPPQFDATANCQGCANEWTGVACDTCPPQFDATANCSGCANEWTGAACDSCPANFDEADNCAGCSDHWTGLACDTCRGQWTGSDCNTCPANFNAADSCASCATHWVGVACDQCPLQFTVASNCTTCANNWTGADCNACPANYTTGSNCAECSNMWSGANCDVCPAHVVQDGSCDTCERGWFPPDDNCLMCRFYVSATGSDANDGLDWAAAKQDLQLAIDAAAAQVTSGAPYCEVWVKAGTYRSYKSAVTDAFLLKPNVRVYGGFAGTEATLAERNVVSNLTTLTGASATVGVYSENVVRAGTTASGAVLDGFTIAFGMTKTAPPAAGECGTTRCWGGGLHIDGTNVAGHGVTVANCTFDHNFAYYDGGAVMVKKSPMTTFTGCTFANNAAREQGGAVEITESDATFTNCIFSTNTVGPVAAPLNQTVNQGFGGAISVWGSTTTMSHVTLNGCTFTSNAANFPNPAAGKGMGGAIFTDNRSEVVISGGTFTTNRASNHGGAIALYRRSGDSDASEPGLVSLDGVDLLSNEAYDNDATPQYHMGGAVYMSAGTVLVTGTGTEVFDSMGSKGGAFAVDKGILNMEDGVVSFNTATDVQASDPLPEGGAIYVNANGIAEFLRTKFHHNHAGRQAATEARGGAIAAYGPLTVTAGMLWHNSAGGSSSWGGAIYASGTGGVVTLDIVDLDGNSTNAMGGAVTLDAGASGFFQTVRVTNNVSFYGGGLAVRGATLQVSDSVIAGNSASGTTSMGGGLWMNNATTASSGTTGDPTVLVSNSVIAGNWATTNTAWGGGVLIGDGVLTLGNSTVYANDLPARTDESNTVGGGNIYVSQYAHLDASDDVIAMAVGTNNISWPTLNTSPFTITYTACDSTYSGTGNIAWAPLDFATAPSPSTGTWTAAAYSATTHRTTFTFSTDLWPKLTGLFAQVDTASPRLLPVVRNEANSMTVPGEFTTATPFKLVNLRPKVGTDIAKDFIDKGGPAQLESDITGQAPVCVRTPANANGCRDVGAYEYVP